MHQSKLKEPLDQVAIEKKIMDFTRRFIVWASDGVVKAYISFRNCAKVGHPELFLAAYENMIVEIRKDLGNKNDRIKQYELLSLFINDIDAVLPKK